MDVHPLAVHLLKPELKVYKSRLKIQNAPPYVDCKPLGVAALYPNPERFSLFSEKLQIGLGIEMRVDVDDWFGVHLKLNSGNFHAM